MNFVKSSELWFCEGSELKYDKICHTVDKENGEKTENKSKNKINKKPRQFAEIISKTTLASDEMLVTI